MARPNNPSRHAAKLTIEIVQDVRANRRGMTAKQWASHIGCHYRTIEKIRSWETWGNVRG